MIQLVAARRSVAQRPRMRIAFKRIKSGEGARGHDNTPTQSDPRMLHAPTTTLIATFASPS